MTRIIAATGFCALLAARTFAMAPSQGEGGGGGGYSGIILIVGIFAVMYFFMIRPQQKKQKEKEEMIKALSEGDEIVTAGGIHGTVRQVKDTSVRVQIDDKTRVELEKSSVAAVVAKGQIDATS